jgi:hypothetical protein
MIQLRSDCLFLKTPEGETFPCSAEIASVEVVGETTWQMDPELVQHAAQAVLHYFRHELGRDTVSVGEFSEALQKVLGRLGLNAPQNAPVAPAVEAQPGIDLQELANSAGEGFELAFFSRLREALRENLSASPPVVRFTGLKGSVKTLLGARKWNEPCRQLSDQIVAHLRQCLHAEGKGSGCTLLVE